MDRCVNLRPEVGVDGDPQSDAVRMVAQSSFGYWLAVGLFDEHGMGAELDSVARPGLAGPSSAGRATTFVLVGEMTTVATVQNVHGAADPQVGACERSSLDVVTLFNDAFELSVKSAAAIHRRVGSPNSFHLFEVEKALAVCQSVERGHADELVFHGDA